MSKTNVDVVRSFYPEGGLRLTSLVATDDAADVARRTLAPHVAPGFEWAGHRDVLGAPDPVGGLDAFVESYREISQAFEDATLRPIEITEHGEKVLVIARLSGRLARSDAPFETVAAAVYSFEGEKLKRVEEFTDLDRARAVASAE